MHRWSRRLAPYLFISPFFVGYAVFFLYPVLASLRLSFFNQTGINTVPRFIGFGNYERLLSDDLFLKSVLNTSYYAVGSLLLIVPLALGLALLMHMPKLRFREFFRLLYFTPTITSGVIVGIIFGLVFNEQYGLINNMLLAPIGVEPVRWLRDPTFIMPAIILLGVWKFTGINALYFLVGLQNISPEYREAAIVDGATRWQVFRHVTFPLLRPVFVFVLTLALVGSYKLFAEPVTLLGTTGGPNNAGLTMVMYLYNVGFRELKFGYASAVGYALTLIILVLSLVQLYVTGSLRED